MVLYLSTSASMIFNIVTFPAFIFLSIILLYLGRTTNPEKRITLPWISLSLGVFLMGIPYLLEMAVFFEKLTEVDVFVPSYFFVLVGALMTFTSFTLLYVERIAEIKSLRKEKEDFKQRLREVEKNLI